MSRTLFRRSHVALVVFALVAVSVLTTGQLPAAAATSRLTLSGPPSALDGESFALVATLRSDGSPVAGATLQLERQVGDAWHAESTATTDRDGVATVGVTQDGNTAPAVFRATFAGTGDATSSTSGPVTVALAESAAEVTIAAPDTGLIKADVTVRATVRRADDGTPLAAVPVRIERRRDGGWVEVATLETDGDGRASAAVRVRREPTANRFRSVFPGTTEVAPGTSEVAEVTPERARTVLRLRGPAKIVDETAATLRLRWLTRDGRPVPGVGRVWSRSGAKDWRAGPRLRFGKDGRAELLVRPRVDSRWKVVGPGGTWWRRDVSAVHALDNVPPGEPVAYPANAPRPRVKVPRQPRAVGGGANGKVSRIPNAVWKQMTGRSWHRGCPVGRSELRLVRINYWGYDGYRYRGELVVRDDIARKTVRVFSALYRARLPIRSMYRVDRFGWSDYLHGGDNYDSMAAGNTSAFNCRGVVGNPSVPSPHSYGRSIDVNTWENPYHSRRGWVPNSWWVSHSHPRIAWRSGEHPVVRIMRANGFRWTYGTQDAHHFDG